MLRKTETISRLLLAALAVGIIGCPADSPKGTSDQIVGPTVPITVSVTLTSSKKSMFATAETSALLTVTVKKDGLPVADLTPVTITTTLGSLDGPTGGTSVTLLTIGGKVTVQMFPGGTEGTARLTATALGGLAIGTITILPASGIIVPPTASTLLLSVDSNPVPNDATTVIAVTATVLGTDTKPFKQAPVQFATTKGLFSSSGTTLSDILSTNTSGQVSDDLTVTPTDLSGVTSFTVTATLFVEGGGSIVVPIVITVTQAPTASGIDLILIPDATVNDDGTPQSATLRAIVTDNQNPPQPIEGVTVNFSTGLGDLTDNQGTTDAAGIAEVDLDLDAADLANFCLPTFSVTASITGDSDSETITIARTPLVASFSYVGVSNTEVDFTDTSTGSPDSWDWDFDNDGLVDLTTQDAPDINLQSYGFSPGETSTVKLTVRRGICTSDVGLQSVTNPV